MKMFLKMLKNPFKTCKNNLLPWNRKSECLLKCSSLVQDVQITQLGGEEKKTTPLPRHLNMTLADLKELALSLLGELTRGLRFISLDWTFTSDAEKNSGLCTKKTESHCM